MSRDELITAFMFRPERAADEVLRLRDALQRVGEVHPDAKRLAEVALAIWSIVDTFAGPKR